jgi:ketosteroid isomerase-like protein
MSIEENVQTVKDFFAAVGRGDKKGLLALSAEDIGWIIPGEDWPLILKHLFAQSIQRLPAAECFSM